jgi:hypothetical protein
MGRYDPTLNSLLATACLEHRFLHPSFFRLVLLLGTALVAAGFSLHVIVPDEFCSPAVKLHVLLVSRLRHPWRSEAAKRPYKAGAAR